MDGHEENAGEFTEESAKLQNTAPAFFSNSVALVLYFLSSYGWWIVVGCALAYWIWLRSRDRIEKWKDAAERHRNPDKFIEREESIAAARLRMQERYSQMATEHALKEKEKEEKRREEARIKGLNETSTNEEPKSKKPLKPLRPEWNPMMADTRSCSLPRRRGGG